MFEHLADYYWRLAWLNEDSPHFMTWWGNFKRYEILSKYYSEQYNGSHRLFD